MDNRFLAKAAEDEIARFERKESSLEDLASRLLEYRDGMQIKNRVLLKSVDRAQQV